MYYDGKLLLFTCWYRVVASSPAGQAMAGPVFVSLWFAHAQYSYLLLHVQLRFSYKLITGAR